jgi:FixJ family two-component response regulator
VPPADHASAPLVIVTDDDDAVRASLKFALETEGFRVETWASGEALLAQDLPADRACLVIDERLPGIGGLATVDRLRARGVRLPAMLITTNPGRDLRRTAAATGVPIIEKPLLTGALLDAIRHALEA